MGVTRMTYELNPKQEEALNVLMDHTNGIEMLLFGGGAGGGKSWLLVLWLSMVCNRYPGTRWVLGRSKLKQLKLTTLNTFFKFCKKYGIKRGEHYTFNQQDNVLTWRNGSEILLMDLFLYPSDPDFDRLGSLEITGAAVDECNQTVWKAIQVLFSRIREGLDRCHVCYDAEITEALEVGIRESGSEYIKKWLCGHGHRTMGLIPKLAMSCNPAKNWVFSEFYDPSRKGTLPPDRKFIQSLVTDNDFIPEVYVKSLNKLDDRSRKRLRFGSWEYSGDYNIFDYLMLQEGTARKRIEGAEKKRHLMAVDPARLGKDRAVAMVVTDEMEIVHIQELTKVPKGTPEAKRVTQIHTEEVKEIMARFNVDEYDLAIDSDGVGGGLADNFECAIHIVNNARPKKDENYYNYRTQLYFRLAQAFNTGEIAFNKITDEQAETIVAELMPLERVKADQDGKIFMTTKEQVKAMLNRSPDYADCLAYLMSHFVEQMYL